MAPIFSSWRIALLGLALAACGGGNSSLDDSNGVAALKSKRDRAQALAQPAQSSWSPLLSLPLVPVAMSHLPDGRLLMWSAEEKLSFGAAVGRTYSATFDPTSGLLSERVVTETDHNMFCPGTVKLADGRLLVNGGIGSSKTSLYDPVQNTWSAGPAMVIPRGYNASTLLPNGGVLTLGGSWSGGAGGKDGEVFTPGGAWQRLSGVRIDTFLSADPSRDFGGDSHFWLIPSGNGKVFHAGPGVNMHWVNTWGNGSTTRVGTRADDVFSINGSAVMFERGKLLKVGGAAGYDGFDANANSFVIDINAAPTTRRVSSMAYQRVFHNSVVLPNGQVVVLGGQTFAKAFTDDNSVLVPELFDPATERFTPLPPMAVARNYHSTALLLPDARVLVAGGGLCGAGCAANHADLQILTPAYLLNDDGSPADRPVISSPPTVVRHGQTVTVTTDRDVSSFSMVRMASVTHSVSNDQRRLVPVFRRVADRTYQVDMPSNPGWALPGDWMLFALNDLGTPSVGKVFRVSIEGSPSIRPVDDQKSATGRAIAPLQPQISAAGTSGLRYSATGLPAGLALNPATGAIEGTPSTAGTSRVSWSVRTDSATVSTEFVWTVEGVLRARYVALMADSEINGNAWASAAEINVLGADGKTLPRTGWRARANSQETWGGYTPVSYVLDGNPRTLWHTQWWGSTPRPPHWVTLDMRSTQSITGLRYLPRQDGGINGTVAQYRVLLSTDGTTWSQPVAQGNFNGQGGATQEKTVVFSKP